MQALIVRVSRSPWLRLPWLVSAAFAAVVLTFFAVFRVDSNGSPHVSFRHHVLWRSTQTLRIVLPGPMVAAQAVPLAEMYGEYGSSDAVRARILRDGPLKGTYEFEARILRGNNGAGLDIRGVSRSRAHASAIASRVSRALQTEVSREQNRARIPSARRVRLEIASGVNARQIGGRRLLWPLATLVLVLGLLTGAGRSRLRSS